MRIAGVSCNTLGSLHCKKVKRKTFLVAILTANLVFSLTVYFIYNGNFTCGRFQADEAISSICNSYSGGRALGNMCHDLCVLKNIKPTSCQPTHIGKDVVFVASWQGSDIVMKSSRLKAEQYDPVYWIGNNESFVYPDEKTFHDMVVSSTKWSLNTSCYSDQTRLFERIWTVNITRISELPTNSQHAAMSNIWSLVQQPEYLFSKCFEHKNIFPKIIGSCGYMYAMEYIPSLPTFMHLFYPSWREDFMTRAKWARLLLKHVEQLDSIQADIPALGRLHICDVKINHFGFDGNQIKLLDADMLFFESALIPNIKMVNKCSCDKDCSFIDCEGACNVDNSSCSPLVKDNNLKRICRNVFSGHITHQFGLLGSPPKSIAKELHRILSRCNEADSKNTKEQLLELLNRDSG